MPSQMVASIRTVPESIVQVLMLLLQLVIHLLEQGPLELEETMRQETASQVQNMMNEMQVHRRMLEGLIAQQGRGRAEARHSRCFGRERQSEFCQPSNGKSDPSTYYSSDNPTDSCPRSGICDRGMVRGRVVHHRGDGIGDRSCGPCAVSNKECTSTTCESNSEGRSRGMTIQEWGNLVVTWGRKHRGKTFRQVMDEAWGYGVNQGSAHFLQSIRTSVAIAK